MIGRRAALGYFLGTLNVVLAGSQDSRMSQDLTVINLYVIDSPRCLAKYLCNSTDQNLDDSPAACSCSDSCGFFGTCCTDRHDAATDKRLPRSSYSCERRLLSDFCDTRKGITVVNQCPRGTEGGLNDRCTLSITANQADLLSTPVTDYVTGITYRNIYCATCWGVQRSHIASWMWQYSCPEILLLRERPRPIGAQNATADNDGGLADLLTAAKFVRDTCWLRYVPPANVTGSLHTCLPGVVDDCPVAANESVALACLDGAAALAYRWNGLAYKNRYCALCQPAGDVIINELDCEPQPAGLCSIQSSFTVLLSPGSNRCPFAGIPLTNVLPSHDATVPAAELCARVASCILDRTLDRSRLARDCSFLCPVGEFEPDGGCRVRNGTRSCHFFQSDDEANAAAAAAVQRSSASRSSAGNDVHIDGNTLVVPINDTLAACFSCSLRTYATFAVGGDGVLRVNDSEGVAAAYQLPFYVISDGGRIAIACEQDSGAGSWKLRPVAAAAAVAGDCHQLPDELTTALLAVSEACLVLFLVLYASSRRLRRFPGDMVANESCAFFVAFLLFLLRPLAEDRYEACTVLAVGIHYFLLAAFAWMGLYAVEIVRALSFGVAMGTDAYAVTKLNRRRVASYVLGWGLPLLIVAAALIADAVGADFRPAYGPPQCFIGERLGNRVFLMGPLCLSVLVCVVVYAYMTIKLVVIARQTRAARGGGFAAHGEKLALSVKLLFTLGLLWIFAVLSSFVDSQALACAFVVLNSLQGAFLLAVYACNRALCRSVARWSRRWRLLTRVRTQTTQLSSLSDVG